MYKTKTETEKHIERINFMIEKIRKGKDTVLGEIDKDKGWKLAIETLEKQRDYFRGKLNGK